MVLMRKLLVVCQCKSTPRVLNPQCVTQNHDAVVPLSRAA